MQESGIKYSPATAKKGRNQIQYLLCRYKSGRTNEVWETRIMLARVEIWGPVTAEALKH